MGAARGVVPLISKLASSRLMYGTITYLLQWMLCMSIYRSGPT